MVKKKTSNNPIKHTFMGRFSSSLSKEINLNNSKAWIKAEWADDQRPGEPATECARRVWERVIDDFMTQATSLGVADQAGKVAELFKRIHENDEPEEYEMEHDLIHLDDIQHHRFDKEHDESDEGEKDN